MVIVKNCQYCGTSMLAKTPRKKWCSVRCKSAYTYHYVPARKQWFRDKYQKSLKNKEGLNFLQYPKKLDRMEYVIREFIIPMKGDRCEKTGQKLDMFCVGHDKKIIRALHHKDPKDKKFGITVAYCFLYSDDDIIDEINKCGLLSNSEHAKYHAIIGRGVYHSNFDYPAHYHAWIKGEDCSLERFIK